MMRRRLLVIVALVIAAVPAGAGSQTLSTAIDRLVSFDYQERTDAARAIRRAPAPEAVPALIAAARSHRDSYVRYKALVLLAGFGDGSAAETMRALIADSNDRVRAVVYAWYEQSPDPAVVPAMVDALDREPSEFVRPALTRALAAAHAIPAARSALTPAILRGEDFFRGSVIEALGNHDAQWAIPTIEQVARLDGPLQDDAIIALGRLRSRGSLQLLAALQKDASRETQPSLAAATCLIARDCSAHEDYLRQTLVFAASDTQYQPLLRSAAFALAALGSRGSTVALSALLDAAEPAADPARAALALAVGHVVLRNPAFLIDVLAERADRRAAIAVVQDAFDMLNEDFDEERFFVEVRRAYWAAAEGSVQRAVARALIDTLEF